MKCLVLASVPYKLHLSNSVGLEQEVLERPTDGHCFPLSSDSLLRGVPASLVERVRVCARTFSFNLQLEPLCWGKTKGTKKDVQLSAVSLRPLTP